VGIDDEPHYRYSLHVPVEPTDRGTLVDALEDESFAIGAKIGFPELFRRIDEGELYFEAKSLERIAGFEHDIEVLSVYLSQYIVGREYHVRPTRGAPLIEGWKVIGRSGEVVRLLLDFRYRKTGQEDDLEHDEDLEDLIERWPSLPLWLRDAMRLKYPRLRAL
jgi:hypothetical protein